MEGKQIQIPLPIPNITTERLQLEALGMTHSAGMYALWSDAQVCRYSGVVSDYEKKVIPTPVASAKDSDRIIDFWQRAVKDGWGFRWAVCLKSETQEFVGTVGYNSLSQCAEIAYHLLPAYWGQGLMYEACMAAVVWARDQGVGEQEAFVEPANLASVALAGRLQLHPTDEFSEGAQRFSSLAIPSNE